MPYRVLVIEGNSESTAAHVYHDVVLDPSFECLRTAWSQIAPERLNSRELDLIVAVAPSGSPEVLSIFEWLRGQPLPVPTFAVLPEHPDETLLQSAAQTADEFILQPIRAIELRHRLCRVLAEPRHDLEIVRRRLLEEIGLTQLIGKSPVFLAAIGQVPRFARAEVPVLITGETGTGKELCARALHHLSRRRRFSFTAVDCGAVPDQLFENELFGHARGAFTDAHRNHRGLVAMAEGGTLFLDEVDALSPSAQGKLLRFLQERTYRPLGADRLEQSDVKVVAASNRDLDACVRDRQFRQDLYFRLNVLRIHLPPLRERRGDIELLAYAALREFRESIGASAQSFSLAALRMLTAYHWPGNVRELYNVVQRAVVSCDGERILPAHLAVPNLQVSSDRPVGDFRAERAAALAAFERRYIEELLRKHNGNVTHAAREAQQDRRAFGRFIKKYKINRRALVS